jgi:hypothetical protein
MSEAYGDLNAELDRLYAARFHDDERESKARLWLTFVSHTKTLSSICGNWTSEAGTSNMLCAPTGRLENRDSRRFGSSSTSGLDQKQKPIRRIQLPCIERV